MDRRFILAGIALVVLVIVRRVFRRQKPVTPAVSRGDQRLEELLSKVDTTPDSPINFGYKISWLAVRTDKSEDVVASLTIDHLQPGNWRSGFIAAYNGGIFVTPAINGWVLVVSSRLPSPETEKISDEWMRMARSLSAKFGELQFFGTHRVVGYNAWAQFINGHEVRSYAFLGDSGETLIDRGARTSGENDLGYKYFDTLSPESKEEAYWERKELCFPDEDHVMELAGKWSVNPNTLETLNLPDSAGWVGVLRRPVQ